MRGKITVHVEHLSGPSEVEVSGEFEPNQEAFNHQIADAMTSLLNDLLGTMMSKRDHIRFEEERESIRVEPATAKGE